MSKKINYKKESFETLNDLILNYNKNEFKSPYRSTIPLLILFKLNPNISFGLVKSSEEKKAKYTLEFETPVIKGKGRSSCTDLMIEYPHACITVEAKRTEPPYIIVSKWLKESKNKRLVLEGWIEVISKHTGIQFDINSVLNLPYQLIHRVASACKLSKTQTNIVYVGFDLTKNKTKYYSDSLTIFSGILENKINFYLARYKIEKLNEQTRLELLWDSKDRNLSVDIIKGLNTDSLMRLTEITIEKISSQN